MLPDSFWSLTKLLKCGTITEKIIAPFSQPIFMACKLRFCLSHLTKSTARVRHINVKAEIYNNKNTVLWLRDECADIFSDTDLDYLSNLTSVYIPTACFKLYSTSKKVPLWNVFSVLIIPAPLLWQLVSLKYNSGFPKILWKVTSKKTSL